MCVGPAGRGQGGGEEEESKLRRTLYAMLRKALWVFILSEIGSSQRI